MRALADGIQSILISALGHLGLDEDAKAAIADLNARKPEVDLEFVTTLWPIGDARSLDYLVDGLRKAGFE